MVAKRKTKKKVRAPGARPWAADVAHISKDLRGLARQVARLRPDPDNARVHDERNIETIRASLEAHGQQKPIVLKPNGKTVAAGSGTLLAARLLGWKWIAAIRYDRDPDGVAAYAVTDNRSAELATWDEATLASVFRHYDEVESGRAMLPGWSVADVNALYATDKPDTPKDEAPPVPTDPVSVTGEVYELGPHRVYCGDVTDESTIATLLGDKLADLVLTDPPYAIYGSSSGLSPDITDDKIVRPFFYEVCKFSKAVSRSFAHIYIFCDWRSWASWWEMGKRARITAKNLLVWDKGGGGLGNMYANTYELVGFFANVPERKVMSAGESGQRPVLKPNIVRCNRATGDDRQHNAAKPVDLIGELITNSSDKGELVVDPFLGSGTTLIAAEQLGRTCYGIEIEPRYVDVIRQRYANFVKDAAFSPTGTLDA